MQIVLDDGEYRHELDVVVHDPEATVADLVEALADAIGAPDRPGPAGRSGGALGLEAEGTPVPPQQRLDRSGIRSGATVRLVPVGSPVGAGARSSLPATVGSEEAAPGPAHPGSTGPGPAGSGTGPELAVVGGLDAGARLLLAPGPWVLGRPARPDPTAVGSPVGRVDLDHDTVSEHHAALAVSDRGGVAITDTRSLNGTWVDGVPAMGPTPLAPGAIARAGAVQVTVRPAPADDRPAPPPAGTEPGGPTVPFNRPPRPAPPATPEPVDTPAPPHDSSPPAAVGVVAVLAPLAGAGALILLTGQGSYALLLVLSPVLALAHALDARRRRGRGRRREEVRYRRQLAELADALAARAGAERDRRTQELPDPAEVLRRVHAPSTRLWERRPGHGDWLRLRVGIGPEPWEPPVRSPGRLLPPPEVRSVLVAASRLVDAPVALDLAGGGVVGVVGPRPAALAVARGLVVQAAALHGPADLPVLVATGPSRARDWTWARWLPHTLEPGGSGARRWAADPDRAEGLCRALLEGAEAGAGPGAPPPSGPPTGPVLLVVVDDESLTGGRRSPVRAVLAGRAGPVAGIVVAATADRLPASCTAVVELLDGDGLARLHRVQHGVRVDDVLASGLSEATARGAARALARFDDPEGEGVGGGLPPAVALLPLLGLDRPDAGAVAARWAAAGPDPGLATPLGRAVDGVLAVDLVRDGPHALVAGTTGAGKSELLRSLVAGLAAGGPPEDRTFLLVDFKGGSAFDRCADLPHVVGVVTDLDAHLAQRALRCLDAELRHREGRLREVGAADLAAYRRTPGVAARAPLPRLVVVVDEFATLRAELPDFVDSLVGVAQRGRSLGVHLVLATQRPSGAVSDNIRANTNLRIALRVPDRSDSLDVIDRPDAAAIGRHQPGRALVRLGPGEVVAGQVALSTGRSGPGRRPVEVRPFGTAEPPAPAPSETGPGAPTDLDRLVEACRRAHAASGHPRPRRPWPDPLPDQVGLDRLDEPSGRSGEEGARVPSPFGAPGARVALALADVPDAQAQVPTGWVPADGNLLLAGLPGSGTTTALAVLALVAARATTPDDLHLYVLDLGRGELGVLAGLPHTGAVVTGAERERQARLVRWLRAELERRREDPAAAHRPRLLVLVDGLGAFRAEWEGAGPPVLADLDRVFAEGPAFGLHLAVAADRVLALPAPLRSLVRQQLLFRLADPLDYAQAGLRAAALPAFGPGRAVEVETGREVQVARPGAGLAAAVARVAAQVGEAAGGRPSRRPPAPVGVLPRRVALSDLRGHARLDTVPLVVPLGIGERTLAPTGLVLHPGEHALVAGPARSGRSTTLAVAGAVAREGGWPTAVVAGLRSPLGVGGDLGPRLLPGGVDDALPALVEGTGGPGGRLLLLVDDMEDVDPDGLVLPAVLARPDVVVVAAGRAEAVRGLYGHWGRALRASRAGVLLQPDVDLDGDLLGVRIPRRPLTALGPGRGYVCAGGEGELIQVASLDGT